MNKLVKLEELLKSTNTKKEFNIVEDLKSLELIYGVVKSRDFRKKLSAIIQKYEQSELTEVREALLEKCRDGDIQAIRLYAEFFKPAEVVTEDDGLIEAISHAGKEVFDEV